MALIVFSELCGRLRYGFARVGKFGIIVRIGFGRCAFCFEKKAAPGQEPEKSVGYVYKGLVVFHWGFWV